MDAWLSRRRQDPRYASERKVTPWYSVGPRFQGEKEVYNFGDYKKDAAPKAKASSPKSPKKKKRKKTESGGSATASSSGSASEGGTKKKGRCWKGYKPAKGKKPYSEGSCVKA